jgi:phosphoglycerate dehydrogenase-like enzyme
MNVLVGVISPVEAWVIPPTWVERLRRQFPQHEFLEARDRDTLRRLLPDADIAFTPLVDRDLWASLSRLRWVQSPAVGVGGLLYPEMTASPVVITNARGIRARAIAEHVIGVTIALARQLPAALRHQVAHQWAQDAIEGGRKIRTLKGLRMGIVGLGSIGLEVARLASALGMRISAVRRRAAYPVGAGYLDGADGIDEVVTPSGLHGVLARSDAVVLSAPLTAATHHLIGRAEVAAMRPGAWLINIGRGKLVDDEALVEGLRSGRLGGLALDVFTHEPLDPASPYWDWPNVIVTPHVAGALEDYWEPLVDMFAENLRRFGAGRPLLNVVDKQAGY